MSLRPHYILVFGKCLDRAGVKGIKNSHSNGILDPQLFKGARENESMQS